VCQCGTSSTNPVIWKDVGNFFLSYVNRSPYGQALTSPSFNLYQNINAYKTVFYLRRKIPVTALYYVTKYLGTKKMMGKVSQLKDAVD